MKNRPHTVSKSSRAFPLADDEFEFELWDGRGGEMTRKYLMVYQAEDGAVTRNEYRIITYEIWSFCWFLVATIRPAWEKKSEINFTVSA